MNAGRFWLTWLLGVAAIATALGLTARMHRYEITIGGGTRYYSVIKLDRWTGQTWRLDNSGTRWNPVP